MYSTCMLCSGGLCQAVACRMSEKNGKGKIQRFTLTLTVSSYREPCFSGANVLPARAGSTQSLIFDGLGMLRAMQARPSVLDRRP